MFRKVVLALCIIGVATAQENFKDCLQKDSISCVQLAVRRKLLKIWINFSGAKVMRNFW